MASPAADRRERSRSDGNGCPGTGCTGRLASAVEACRDDARRVGKSEVWGGGRVLATFAVQRSKRCGTAWATVRTDGPARHMAVALQSSTARRTGHVIGKAAATPMLRVSGRACVTAYATAYDLQEAGGRHGEQEHGEQEHGEQEYGEQENAGQSNRDRTNAALRVCL